MASHTGELCNIDENVAIEESNYMSFGDIPPLLKPNEIEENDYIAFGDVSRAVENSAFEEDEEEECNYMAVDEFPPALPPRSKDDGEKTKCCDSDVCVCYIEVLEEKEEQQAST